ncbi:MAG: transposase [Planctomycetales bacterium 71-10]|nr:MAG: transposase [Planctomycetales bacterium 71-10]
MSQGGESPRKPVVWLAGREHIRSPPLSREARVEAGALLRMIQDGDMPTMPHSRPMPSIGTHCHELRVRDENRTWRLVYRIDEDAVVVASVFSKTTRVTPKREIDACKARLSQYDRAARGDGDGGGR